MPVINKQSEYVPVLKQNSDSELTVAEWHSRLDRVLSFLLRDVGYSLLDDAIALKGGGVKLQAPPWRAAKIAREPRGVPTVDDDEARAMRIGPTAAKYAQYPDDLVLVWRFAGLLAETTPSAADKVHHDTFYKTVLQGVRLMHLCDFNYSDVVVTLAYASCYFRSTFMSIGQMMSETEAAHVCTLLIFLAHCFVLDETCPLRCWQRHVFRRYCTLKVLDAALFRLFNLRGFRLLLSPEEEAEALAALLSSSPKGEQGDADFACSPLNGTGTCHKATNGNAVYAGKCAQNGSHQGLPPCDKCVVNQREKQSL